MNVTSARRRHPFGLIVLVTAALAVGGCGEDASGPDPTPATDGAPSAAFDQELHDELVRMLDDDQTERTTMDPGQWKDVERADRLGEILDEHGWPTFDLVGEDGEDAAWAIAQHADHDVEFQRQALDLLRDAVEAGQASPGNLAYLTDRVAANSDEPQVYGTQVSCDGHTAVPMPLADEDAVDNLRAEAGLPPLDEYLDEFAEGCAAGPGG